MLPAEEVAGGRLVRDAYETELPRMVAGVAVIWQFTILIQVLAYLRYYRHPLIPFAAWLLMLGAAAWLVPRARRGGLGRADAALAVAVAVAVVAMVGWQRRPEAVGSVDWSVAGTCWLLALVALLRPGWEWATGALLVCVTHVIFVLRLPGGTPFAAARLAITGYTLLVVLAVFAALRPALRAQARIAARRSALASQAAAQRAAAAAIQQDRQAQLGLLEAEALPLLRGIAGGALDPAGSEVQARCARCAATLRQGLAGGTLQAGALLAALQPVIAAAQARGCPLTVQVIGDPGSPGHDVLAATGAAIDGMIGLLPRQPLTLTVLASGSEVELFLAFQRPPQGSLPEPEPRPAVAAGWHAAVDVDETGAGCLEIRWRNVPA